MVSKSFDLPSISQVIGVDEVGRGCWAGPMVVGAVILPEPILGLNDSKLLKPSARDELSKVIKERAIFVNTGWVWPDEIDKHGLTRATKLAIERALEGAPDHACIVIDGKFNFLVENDKVRTLIKADGIVPAVSAASIVAKVARDEYMREQATQFPLYGFEKHVGYGTKLHANAIVSNGITMLHRRTFKPIRLLLEPA